MKPASKWIAKCVVAVASCAPLIAGLARCAAAEEAPTAQGVDFQRDVWPILQARCVACHGAERQESDLRLDRRDDALTGGAGGKVIVAGRAAESSLVERIASGDPDTRMPPKGEAVSAEQIALIRAWIDQGAAWPADFPATAASENQHWSLRPLIHPAVPGGAGEHANPIDAFIAKSLADNKLAPSLPAERRLLARRVFIDLIGLPPTPEELTAFLQDESPGAYERLVDRLLASPRYGERWARHWMDVAHFAETHGNDQDRPRPNAWPYRDYLIRAFNEDKPYARFVAEQVAGDVIAPDDPQATIALGFLAAGPWDESSLMCIVDDTTDKRLAQILDRDDMLTNVMSTFTSTTVHCARCHNHKFDPITQADYYSLQAVFSGVDRIDREFDADPAVRRRRVDLTRSKREVATRDADGLLADAILLAEISTAEDELRRASQMWQSVAPAKVATSSGSSAATQADGSVLFAGDTADKDNYTIEFDAPAGDVTALRLEALTDASLPAGGPGRAANGNFHLSEFKVQLTATAATGAENAAEAPASVAVKIRAAHADFDQAGWGVAAAIDGNIETAWGIDPQEGKPHTAVFVLAEPLRMLPGQRASVVLEQSHGRQHLIGRLRLSTSTTPNPSLAAPFPAPIATILALPAEQRSREQRLELARWLLVRKYDRELAMLPAQSTVFAVSNEFQPHNNLKPAGMPRPVHVLRRGDINQPLEAAEPGALSCVTALTPRFSVEPTAGEAARRVALAHWLTDSRNMLTWRSIVNRVWHYHFERGIVDTPNDLGKMGGQPSHPELLDWLALEFQAQGGSLKWLHRAIVTSATYRQSSAIDQARASVDADNRLLWRAPSRRLDAETIRDAVLQASGRLDLTMGGPSVKQFIETKGIHVTPMVDYQTFNVDSPGNQRRSIYRFLFRTLPDPLMESLDCPDGSQLTPSRSASLTALQALAMLDNRFIVRESQHLAERLQSDSASLDAQIRSLFQRALLRDPDAAEGQQWQAYAQRHGLANACRMMFNTNEFMFVH